MNQKLICIDPGHGGLEDSGAKYGKVEEDFLNLCISFYLDYELRLKGHQTILTRQDDSARSLADRCAIANDANADIFVSIHCDAWHRVTASGMTVHRAPCSIKGTKLAERVASEFRLFFPDHRQRGVKSSKFYVLQKTKMPAILAEVEFMSNPKTLRFLTLPENQRRLARAMSKGICYYL